MTTYADSLNKALHQAFAQNANVHLLGEDVLDPYGGAFKITRGLSNAYPDRVRTTPISEAGIVGVATGMALRGLRPVVEIMFGDFLGLCMDQLLNHMTKFTAMYGRPLDLPVVVRTPMGGGRGYGATHSQSIEKYFLGMPALTVIAPSHAHDAGALLAYAVLKDNGPTLFIEHKLLYPQQLLQSGDGLKLSLTPGDYPTALLQNYDSGAPDVTLITYGGVARLAVPLLKRLAADEIKLQVALPSRLSPVNVEPLIEAAAASGRVVIAEEGTIGFGWGAEIAASLYDRLQGKLQGPILRVASESAIIPNARALEDAMLVSEAKIEQALQHALEA